MARQCEHPPSTASIVTASTYEWGDDDWMTARGAARRQPALPHADLRGAPRFVAARSVLPAGRRTSWPTTSLTWASPTSSCFPSWSTRTADRGATRSPGTTRRRRASARPTTSASSSTTCTSAASASSPTGCRRTSPRTSGRWPASTAPPLYEHADPRKGEHPDWGTLVFNYGRHEVRNFLIANALYWLEEFHVDGLRVDAVASMLYLDYSRPAGAWVPNVHGGRENLEAIDFIRQLNTLGLDRASGRGDDRRGVHVVARRQPSGAARRSRASRHKWNMGWMHDTLGYFAHDPVHRRWHHRDLTFGLLYAHSERFVLPLSHDEVVHGKGSPAQQDAGRRVAPLRQPPCAVRMDVGLPGRPHAVHGRRDGAVGGVERHQGRRLGRARRRAAPRACTSSSGP